MLVRQCAGVLGAAFQNCLEQGAVLSMGVFIGASNELGAFESGLAARYLGVPWAIAGGGIATVAIAGSFALLFPSIRRIDTFEELDPKLSPSDG